MTDSTATQSADKRGWDIAQWLEHLLKLHPKNIEMGLERIALVAQSIDLVCSDATVITVAGTNGKGTTCAILEQALLADGASVGVYSSPHILLYRERVRVNGKMLSDQAHCDAFYQVEQARGDIPLTFFEFATLAAIWLLKQHGVDFLLLEVGLGGRLDAVNIIDPDIAVITSIDLDHQDWLGDNRELIGAEKAGIMRQGIDVVIGDPAPPQSLHTQVSALQANALWQGKDFSYTQQGQSWCWQQPDLRLDNLPLPQVPMQNVSTAVAVMQLLDLTLSPTQLRQVIADTNLPGRQQVIAQQPKVILDVAHNPQATSYLAQQLAAQRYKSLYLVVAMLADKDIEQSLHPLFNLAANWLPASLHVPRGASCDRVAEALVGQHIVGRFDSLRDAYRQAQDLASEQDLIVVFGSFFSVAEIIELTPK